MGKVWLDESAEAIGFIREVMEDEFGVPMVYTHGEEARWPAENAEENTDYIYPEIEYTYDRSTGAERNKLFQEYIENLGYSIDFNTALAKLEKDDTDRITGIIAQSNDDGHFIRINAAQGVLLA